MKLTYWYSKCLSDSEAYSIRTRTRREAKALRQKYDPGIILDRDCGKYYGPIGKVTVEYGDAFDLLEQCSSEDHHNWEPWD